MAFIVNLSVVFAAAMIACMAVLIARRWQAERRQSGISARSSAVTRNYLQRLGGGLDVEPPVAGPIALSAVLHLSQLLRGAERDRLLELAEADGLFDLALSKLKRSGPPGRVRAIQMLGQFGGERSVEVLLDRMANDPLPALRLEAASALATLGRLPAPADTVVMLGLAHNTPTRAHSALLRSLAVPHATELGTLLGDPLPVALRCMIVDALGWSMDYSVADLIGQAARDANPEMRCAALRAARQLGRPDAAKWILPLLADRVAEVRVNAIRACDTLQIEQAVEALELLCSDQQWWVRSRAEEALATLRPLRPLSVAA